MSMHKGLLGQSQGGAAVATRKEDTTLGDYIARKQQQIAFEDVLQEKKLTFDEWFYSREDHDLYDIETCRWVWHAAQENK